MNDCEYELVVLKPEDFEEVAMFLDNHFITREPVESIRLGLAAGCNRAAVTITNRYIGSLYRKLGFETVSVLDLTKLEPKYKGRLNFDNMNGNSTICAMIKQGLP
ncbi:Hypothetical predicted protein [Paramuricea clavata]|nr:Hypothetical predicted protein [Paramuricea clavata]